MSSPLSKGDRIKVEPDSNWQVQKLEWSQQGRSMTGKYYRANFDNTTSDRQPGTVIFIQYEKAKEFKSKATMDGDSFDIEVDDSFQYGEARKKGPRWLVYQDKDRKIFQHRFVMSMINEAGSDAYNILDRMGMGEFKNDIAKLAQMMGEFLRSF